MVPFDDEELREEIYAYYDMHKGMCIRDNVWDVEIAEPMGLGLFVAGVGMPITYDNLIKSDVEDSLFMFIEWMDEDDWDVLNGSGYPSMYESPTGMKGVTYGPLMFANHQDWAPPLTDVDYAAKSLQVVLALTRTNHTQQLDSDLQVVKKHATTWALLPIPHSEDINLLSQEIDSEEEEGMKSFTPGESLIVTTKRKSFYVVRMDVDDVNEPIRRAHNDNSPAHAIEVDSI